MNAPALPALSATDFADYFRAVHGDSPFPWQQALLERLACGAGWPAALDLPTAAGKTAALDAALFHLALEASLPREARRAPLRIALVVDRRLVVDGACERARRIAAALQQAECDAAAAPVLQAVAARLRALAASARGDGPVLAVERLRGGVPRENAWAESPLQPLLLLATVDQLGSRLLFRGYGLSEYAQPLHAGLLGEDTLILLDEAHLSQPFLDTVRAVGRYAGGDWRQTPPLRPLQIVPLSATQQHIAGALLLSAADRDEPVLARRLRAAKPAELLECKAEQLIERLTDGARRLLAQCTPAAHDLFTPGELHAPVIGIVVNRIATARAVHARLRTEADTDALLLIGRMRPLDREALIAQALPRMRAGRAEGDNPRALYVVATQTVEVGADLDFDALLTQSAPLDALRQRFGRLNRLGTRPRAPAAIVHVRDADKDDLVYGGAITACWQWLGTVAVPPPKKRGRGQPAAAASVDFGIDALDARLRESAAADTCFSPRRQAPVLLPMHVDLLARTSPPPALSPEPALWLHGPQAAPAEVQLIWRAELPTDIDGAIEEDDERALDTVRAALTALPPSSLEALSLPIWQLRAWLAQAETLDEGADIEGERAPDEPPRRSRAVLRWDGSDARLISSAQIRPGDTLIVPTRWGGLDAQAGWAWNPAARSEVPDRAEAASAIGRQRAVLRLSAACIEHWRLDAGAAPATVNEAIAAARQQLDALFSDAADAPPEAGALCATLQAIDGLPAAVQATLAALAQHGARLLRYGRDGRALIQQRPARVAADDGDESSLTLRVGLEAHCRGVGAQARAFARALGLPPTLVDDLGLAGDSHDLGKADPRFQAWLYGGTRPAGAALLAKSGLDARDRFALTLARAQAGYPRGARHECASVQLLRAHPQLLATAHDAELVEYLVGTHHGRGRPFMPLVDDAGAATLDARFSVFGQPLRLRGGHGLQRLDAGWAERFASLQRRYGWWGLAYLETLLRLADHRRSAEEQRQGGNDA